MPRRAVDSAAPPPYAANRTMMRAVGKRRTVRLLQGGLFGMIGALLPTPSFAYRTGQDSPGLVGQGRVVWAEREPGFYLVNEGLPAGVSPEAAEQVVGDSLGAWDSVDCGDVRPFFAGWVEATPAAMDGLNTIAWVSDWKARGYPSTAPGNTDVQYRGHEGAWQIAEADIYLNAHDFEFSFGAGPGLEAQAVITHELGHALGLLHPCEPKGADGAPDCDAVSSEVAETAMYPFYSAGQSSLAPDDEAGLCYLYPPLGACAPECPRGEECVEGECRASCVSGVCEVGEVCGFWGCMPAGGCTSRSCLGEACKNDQACGPLSRCVDGVCSGGAAVWGDACRVSPDCAEGACIGGVCQPDCRDDTECAPYGTCSVSDEGTAQGCVASGKYETGMRCSEGEDCQSRICIFTANPSICTNACGAAGACPADWSCGTVEGQQVCVPPTYRAAGGGCAVRALAAPSGASAWLGIAAVTVFGVALRRLRRGKA